MYLSPSNGSVRNLGSARTDQSSAQRFAWIAGLFGSVASASSARAKSTPAPKVASVRTIQKLRRSTRANIADVTSFAIGPRCTLRAKRVDLGDVAAGEHDERRRAAV